MFGNSLIFSKQSLSTADIDGVAVSPSSELVDVGETFQKTCLIISSDEFKEARWKKNGVEVTSGKYLLQKISVNRPQYVCNRHHVDCGERHADVGLGGLVERGS